MSVQAGGSGPNGPNGARLAAVPQYLTSRDAAAVLGVPEPDVRWLIRDGTLAGFRADGYWIVRGEAVARYAASAEGAMARLRTDYPGWRIGMLSRCFFAIAGIGDEGLRLWSSRPPWTAYGTNSNGGTPPA